MTTCIQEPFFEMNVQVAFKDSLHTWMMNTCAASSNKHLTQTLATVDYTAVHRWEMDGQAVRQKCVSRCIWFLPDSWSI